MGFKRKYACQNMLILTIVCGVFVFGPCFVMQYLSAISSFAIILLRRRELVALL